MADRAPSDDQSQPGGSSLCGVNPAVVSEQSSDNLLPSGTPLDPHPAYHSGGALSLKPPVVLESPKATRLELSTDADAMKVHEEIVTAILDKENKTGPAARGVLLPLGDAANAALDVSSGPPGRSPGGGSRPDHLPHKFLLTSVVASADVGSEVAALIKANIDREVEGIGTVTLQPSRRALMVASRDPAELDRLKAAITRIEATRASINVKCIGQEDSYQIWADPPVWPSQDRNNYQFSDMESKKPTAGVFPRPRAHQGPGNQLRRWGTESSLMSASRVHREQGDGTSSLLETTRTVPTADVKSFVRIRPRFSGALFKEPAFEAVCDTTVVTTTTTTECNTQKRFRFHKVMPQRSTQEEVHAAVMTGALQSYLKGGHVLVLCCGPTGAGKTHTLEGNYRDPGILPRALSILFRPRGPEVSGAAGVRPNLFSDVKPLSAAEAEELLGYKGKLLQEKGARAPPDFAAFALDDQRCALESTNSTGERQRKVGLWVSSFEVYRDGIYDLLLPSSEARNKEPGKRRVPLKIGEDGAKRAFVKGLLEVPVHSADEAHRLLCLARANQTTAETQLGGRAVRSHLVLTVRMATSAAPGDDDQGSWGVSVLTFIELVSSEKPAKAGGDGSLLREAGHINASLLVLGRCMEAVGLKETSKKGPVPFRDSRLTQVIQPFFTTGAEVALLTNISPALSTFEESLNALKFAATSVNEAPLPLVPLMPRQERCRRAARRLTEVWLTHVRGGDASEPGSTLEPDAGAAPLNAAQTDELFETIAALQAGARQHSAPSATHWCGAPGCCGRSA
ncbi:kinesin-like protein KIF20A [Amblyomma americanum]